MGRSAPIVITMSLWVGSVALSGVVVVAAEQEIVIEDEAVGEHGDTLFIDDGLVIEDDDMPSTDGELVIDGGEQPVDDSAGELVIDPGESAQEDDGGLVIEGGDMPSDSALAASSPARDPSRPKFSVDDAWLEGAYLTDSASPADTLGYGKLSASVNWQPGHRWEFQIGGRLDLYDQGGTRSFTDVDGDYGDSFVRYRGDNVSLTVGTQTLIWGRIDELPPSDRVSTVDLRRFILDDLPDRRVSTPMIRAEAFFGASKLDLVWLYTFREAELPSQESVWYPVNKETGHLFGMAPSGALAGLFGAGASVDEDAPDGDAGFAARYTRTQSNIDFGVTLGRTRQSTPYFRLDGTNFKAEYPRSWIYGLDAALEGTGGTWRFEALYSSDSPVTRTDLSYTTTPALSWGGGFEFHPGDGDTRVNLQLTGINLIDEPSVLDRDEIYSFNGAVEAPVLPSCTFLITHIYHSNLIPLCLSRQNCLSRAQGQLNQRLWPVDSTLKRFW